MAFLHAFWKGRYLLRCISCMGENCDEIFFEEGILSEGIKLLIDPKEVSKIICDHVSKDITELRDFISLLCKMSEEIKINKMLDETAFLAEVKRSFASESLILESLLSAIEHKEVEILEDTGKGGHCKVYKGKRGSMVFAAKSTLHSQDDFREMAENYAELRKLRSKDHLNIMKPFDVGRDITGQVLVLVPYIENDLFIELCHDGMIERQPEDRFAIGLQIVKGCLFLKEVGFMTVDLRPNNIRLQDGCPKIDISKWIGIDTPYPAPDSKPPFHFSPERLRNESKLDSSKETSYGCAILIWMLACGRFIRPRFATEDDRSCDGPEPKVATLCNLPSVIQELVEILEQCAEVDHRGLELFVPMVKRVLEKCLIGETERTDITTLYEILQSQMAVLS